MTEIGNGVSEDSIIIENQTLYMVKRNDVDPP
jgi:hypothetical protein